MMAVDYREEPQHETSTSVASAAAQLRQARAQMELALDRRGLTMEGAVAERLFGLGPAPQAGNLLPAQSNLPLAEDLAALSIDEPAVKVSFMEVYFYQGPNISTAGRTTSKSENISCADCRT